MFFHEKIIYFLCLVLFASCSKDITTDNVISIKKSIEYQNYQKSLRELITYVNSNGNFVQELNKIKSEQGMEVVDLKNIDVFSVYKFSSDEKNLILDYEKAIFSLCEKYPSIKNNNNKEIIKIFKLQEADNEATKSGIRPNVKMLQLDDCATQYQKDKMSCQLTMALESGLGVFSILGGPMAAGITAVAILAHYADCLGKAALDCSRCKPEIH